MENYIVLEMIGEGAFGKVYKGQRKCTNQIVAIKKLSKKGKKEKDLKNLRQEIDILRRLYHENIIQLLDSFETNSEFCLVTELATGQLFEILEEDKKLPETEIKKITQQLCSALFYLHTNNIIHRDIKPQNVLISASGIIKLCDFGFAKAIDNKTMITSIKGTPLYMAPELLKEYPYNKKADLWSLGVILYELYVGQPPFYTNNFQTLMNKIKKENITYYDSMSHHFKEFLKGLLEKNPKDRWDWPKILDHPFIKESEPEKALRIETQENYRKWIIRLKNDKIFNLYESESYLTKFANDVEVESETKTFAAFDNTDSKQSLSKKTSSIMTDYSACSSTPLIGNQEEFWKLVESKANTEEGATSLRKDPIFADKVVSCLKGIIVEEKITDKTFANIIIKILFNVLTKGSFDSHTIDITKNQNILTCAITIFRLCQNDESQNVLLNDIIKVIGLIAKFYCYYSNGIDLSICSGFLRYIPNILTQPGKTSNIYVNLLKAVGIMITAANMVPKRSLLFYKSIMDFNIINVIIQVIKGYKNHQYVLIKSSLDSFAILIHPMNGDIHAFPFLRSEIYENKFEGYNDVKTAFSHIELLKKSFLNVCFEEKIFEILPILYDLENDISLKSTILKIILQMIRFCAKEVLVYFKPNLAYVQMINSVITTEEIEKKLLTQLGLLILIEIVKYYNSVKINVLEYGYEIQKALNYTNKTFQGDSSVLCLTFGLFAESISVANNFIVFNIKFMKAIKEMIRNAPGKGRDDNKKIEGTSFCYLSTALLDYPMLYLEKITKIFIQKDKYKSELLNAVSDTRFEEALIEIVSNSSFKNEISPKGVLSALVMIQDLISCEYKMIIRRFIREHCIKQLVIFIKKKQYNAIADWPGYKPEQGAQIALSIFQTSLLLIRTAAELHGITEGVVKGDFLPNLRAAFDIVNKDYHRSIISIFNSLASGKQDDIVTTYTNEYFSQGSNIKFIEAFLLLKDSSTSKDVIAEVLTLLSSLCRKSSNVYQAIHQLNIFPDLKYLLENGESLIKSRVCNLLGNMCRHTDFFYEEIKKSGIISLLLRCCNDFDRVTRKFACFAIGNAAFLNDSLYDSFKPIIPKMVELLQDPEENTRANSAGALGNFLRCGDSLVNDIIQNKAHEALLKMAENEEMSQIQIIRVSLFALGNFCYHNVMKNEFEKINFRQRIEILKNKFKNDAQLLENIERIKKKLN